jgi:transglutaminase-like putative cysteine protease
MPVCLEPHVLRLLPRGDAAQRVERLHLEIDPRPEGEFVGFDVEGNNFLRAWFVGSHDRLTVCTEARVETLRKNPFDFLLDSEHVQLPLVYSAELLPRLEPYLRRTGRPAGSDTVGQLASRLANETDRQVLPFLTRLCQTIFGAVEVQHRAEGPPRPPHETLTTASGACRDLAVLFIDACRAVGLASRFVSGYQAGSPQQPEAELHAWGEVYLSGAGWRGFDPTHGLAVADRHVALAAGALPAAAAPVSGTFRGTGAVGTLETSLAVECLEARPKFQSQGQSEELSDQQPA